MHIEDLFLFILKYIPFWAVPIGYMGVHFAYLYWLKGYREIAYVWGGILLFCLTSILVYFLMGGPDQITNTFIHIIH